MIGILCDRMHFCVGHKEKPYQNGFKRSRKRLNSNAKRITKHSNIKIIDTHTYEKKTEVKLMLI